MDIPEIALNRRRARSLATVAVLGLLPLVASAAPPPPPGAESNIGEKQSRDLIRREMDQYRRFADAGLTVTAAPANGGQCVIDLMGQYGPAAGQRGPSGSYRFYEIQRWEVSATPSNPGHSPLLYPIKWTTVGNGARHEDNGVGTIDDWTYSVSGGASPQLSAIYIMSTGKWGVSVGPASAPNGLIVTQQQTVTGTAPRPPGTSTTAAPEYLGFGNMTAAPPVGAPPGTPARAALSATLKVPQNVNWGYARPAYATGTIACTWTLSLAP